ncbi:RING-H2 finger protein ATL67-like [Rhodamnia argentea]|uniref:RING-H2 finger protein ATL67-like n=1 Tax=Rhodamnia argentea TaxID=178133 RepID=A0ABM3HED2_9MYRT|nr:RING-H2 finger protein ATL67-like [Rhodamnia argentea]
MTLAPADTRTVKSKQSLPLVLERSQNMNSSPGSGGTSSDGYAGDISSFAYDMVFIIGFIVLVLVITLSSYLCIRANRRAVIPARIVLRRFDVESAQARRGIDEATLRGYPTVLFSSVKHHEKNNSADSSDGVGGGSCSICLGEYKESDVLRLLPECGHFFHMKCVDPWLRLHATCPVCRKSPVPVAVRADGNSHGGDR